MSKSAILLVSNPTHYTNALDFVAQFNSEIDRFELLIVSEFTAGIEEINRGINELPWYSSQTFTNYRMSGYLGWRKTYAILVKEILAKDFDYYVISNFSDPLHYLLCLKLRADNKQIIALDDGTPTLKDLWNRRLNLDYKTYHLPSFKVLLRILFVTKTFLPFCKTIDKLIFFSIFQVEPMGQDSLIYNEMILSKQRAVPALLRKEEVYFLGSQMVDKGLVNMTVYLNSLKKISAYFENIGLKVKYIMHRAASEKIIEEVSKILEVTSFPSPIESVISDSETKPIAVGSFFSSALFSLRELDPDLRLYAFKFRDDEIIGNAVETKDYIQLVYQTLILDARINVIPLDNILMDKSNVK